MVKEKKETALLGADNSKEPGRSWERSTPQSKALFITLNSTK